MTLLSLLTNFAGPICFSPATERDDFFIAAIIIGLLVILGWVILGIATLIFHFRKTFSRKRKIALHVVVGAQFLMFTALALGIQFGGTESTDGYCKEAVSTTLGSFLFGIAILFFIISLLVGIVFIFLFEKKARVATS